MLVAEVVRWAVPVLVKPLGRRLNPDQGERPSSAVQWTEGQTDDNDAQAGQ